MPNRPYDKLDHFLNAYVLPPEWPQIIRDRVYQAGLSPDDPLAILIAQDGIMEARLVTVLAGLQNFPAQMERSGAALSAEISSQVTDDIDQRMADLLDRLRDQVGANVDLAIQTSVRKADMRLFRRVALQAALVCLLSAGLAGSVGYVQGRQDTQKLEGGFSEVAGRADAETWLDIILNNPDINSTIKQKCAPGSQNHIGNAGRIGCAVPLWIDDKSNAKPGVFASNLGMVMTLGPLSVPVWIFMLCSLFIGMWAGFAIKVISYFRSENGRQ